jgi:tetratricopeptide (TPR) repeat protein
LRFDRTGQRLAWAPVGGQSQRLGLFSVAEGREYRYLVHAGPAGDARDGHWRHWRQPAVHGGGRLAAVGQAEGVALFDLETGRELAHVPVPGSHYACFDGAGHLLTNGFDGFFRWPVRSDPALPGRLVVGPPERLPFHGGIYPVSASQDGRVIAQAMFAGYGMAAHAGGWVLHPNSPTPRHVDPGASMNWTSVSPDGRWVAFGVNGGGVSVYDAATGARVCQPPANGYAHRFSADGRWLLTTGDNGRLFAAGTWEPGPQLGPGEPWDTTPELAVLGQSNGVYRLVELATGRELARLEDQEQNTGPAVFSPDGTRLVVEAENALRVWDLRRIRAGLTAMGLDWDAPPYPKADDAGSGPPLEVTIARGDIDAWPWAQRMADELRRKGDLAGALAAIRQAHAVSPDDAHHNHYLAYMLALCPDPKVRDARRAVELATKSVAVVPDRWEYQRALGIAHHVAGQEMAAVQALTRSLELRPDGDAFDYFPLAAAHQQLGNKEEARKWYDRGVAWMATHKHPYAAELSLLRADAERCLGLGNEPKPAPDRAAPDEKEQATDPAAPLRSATGSPVQRRNERSGR